MILYGQSAGAGAVFSYAYSYPTDPIVSGFVASSGGASTNNPADLNPNFQSVAGILGCGNLTAAAELACMQKVDAEVLRDAVVENKMAFRPIVDDVTMFTNLTERLEKGLVAKKPLITGFTYNEMGAFGPVPGNTTTTATPSNTTTPSSGGLACGAKREATARAAYNLTTYSYLYSGNFSNVTPLPQMGGMHSCKPPPPPPSPGQKKVADNGPGKSRHPNDLRHAPPLPGQLDRVPVADEFCDAGYVPRPLPPHQSVNRSWLTDMTIFQPSGSRSRQTRRLIRATILGRSGPSTHLMTSGSWCLGMRHWVRRLLLLGGWPRCLVGGVSGCWRVGGHGMLCGGILWGACGGLVYICHARVSMRFKFEGVG